MTLRTLLLGASALALVACGQREAAPAFAVSDVQVTADLDSVSSRRAAAYWGNLETDLASAIAAEYVGQTAPTGWVIAVDVDELALSSLLAGGPGGAADARLTGDVALIDPRTGDAAQRYVVSASADEAETLIAAQGRAVAVSPTDADFYAAVIQAFANGVRGTIEQTPLP